MGKAVLIPRFLHEEFVSNLLLRRLSAIMIVKVRKNRVKDIIYFLVHVTPGTHVYNEPHPSPIILRGAWTLT